MKWKGGKSMGWIRKMLVRWLVGSADSVELSRIVLAVLCRYGQLFAEEEVVFLSLPKHNIQERRRIIQGILDMEENRD